MRIVVLLSFFLLTCVASAQHTVHNGHLCFREITLQTDTNTFSLSKDHVIFNEEKHLAFFFSKNEAVCEVKLYPTNRENIQKISLMPSADFDVIDSVFRIGDFYKFKVRFENLTKSRFVSFNLVIGEKNGQEIPCEVKLLPYTQTLINFYPKDDELYVGEEKIFELAVNHLDDIRINPAFTQDKDINYRTEIVNNQLRLYLLPTKLGEITAVIDLQTLNPFLDEKNILRYNLPTIRKKFKVKGSRLAFLNSDIKDITLDDVSQKQGVEIQLEFSRLLALQKTYRIDNQEAPGGALVAEIFTKSYLSNGKILCIVRPYAFHRLADGYLYIKNGDEPLSITNFTITPKTTITAITVLHEGGRRDNNLLPGETVDIRIEGLALNKANFRFENLNLVASDSLIKTETVQTFKLKVPLDLAKKEIDIFNRNEKTGRTISLNEFQRAKPLDFISVNFGRGKTSVTALPQTVLYDRILREVEISFDYNKIDGNDKLYGRQYIDIEITVFGAKGELVEIKKINDLLICPGENSPRFAFYNDKSCNRDAIFLNTLLGRKTYDLDGWSKVEIVISHEKEKYPDGSGFSKKIELILQRYHRFDTDVSFPGGLLIKRGDQSSFSPFGGISLAIIQQMSFYNPEKINRFRPYKIGVGILANNAFNFSETAQNRDVGVVLLGSLYPTRRDVKLSFPLFAGIGYFLGDSAWFFLVGPGIYVNL
ncbi:MAG: hypothetical protein H7Y04_16815 [Verrucomicrobia bacterium]|nr:hypothetical protein [Cytophagales bacterium]